jgi:hypothetical protein
MTARIWLRLVEIFVPVLITATIILSWQADRRDRAELASNWPPPKKQLLRPQPTNTTETPH